MSVFDFHATDRSLEKRTFAYLTLAAGGQAAAPACQKLYKIRYQQPRVTTPGMIDR